MNFEKMVSTCKMYQHLLHLIHIPTFLVDLYVFLQIPTNPTFLPVLLAGQWTSCLKGFDVHIFNIVVLRALNYLVI